MVPIFTELEEPNIAAIWKEEDIIIVSHGSHPEPIAGDRGEPSIIPPTSESRGSEFEVDVRKQLASLSRALRDHLDMITRCMEETHHGENRQAFIIHLLEAQQLIESEHEEEDPSKYVFQRHEKVMVLEERVEKGNEIEARREKVEFEGKIGDVQGKEEVDIGEEQKKGQKKQ